MKDIKIEKMTLSDLDKISGILTTDFDDFWNKNILKTELENSFSKYIVAKIDTEIVGFAGVIDTIDQLEITNIVVRKSYREQGIGNKLLGELINIAKKNNKNEMILEVNNKNFAAIKLYEKNGFKNIGIRKKYYHNIDDAIIMSLDLK